MCNKTLMIFLSSLTLGVANIASENKKPIKEIEEVIISELTCDDDDLLADIDLDNLRSFDETVDQGDMSLKDKLEMAVLLFKLKTRGYKNGLLEHLEQHSNEYLLGSACIAATLIGAVFKNYMKKPALEVHGK